MDSDVFHFYLLQSAKENFVDIITRYVVHYAIKLFPGTNNVVVSQNTSRVCSCRKTGASLRLNAKECGAPIYKVVWGFTNTTWQRKRPLELIPAALVRSARQDPRPVSYTHLTLPTSDLV